jgi:fatty-acyl-CoA synthase
VLIADRTLLEVLAAVRPHVQLEHVIVVGDGDADGAIRYDDLVCAADVESFMEPPIDERDACSLCFTTGTTGRPKGVVYSHRAVALQALSTMAVDFGGVRESDTILLVVPMFHGNAWNHPYAGALAGSALVLPHADLRAVTVLETIERERVTMTGGVPTVWQDVLDELDRRPGRFDVSSLRAVRIGGSRLPLSLLRGLEERHGVPVLGGFGMTELGPIGGIGTVRAQAWLSDDEHWEARARTGRPLPFLEVRARGEDGIARRDGRTIGELEFRGPSVSDGYLGGDGAEALTDDGWLRSGDLATIDEHGTIDIRDRKKDMIKSGGEWISSVALEEALATHPGVREAAVIGVAHPRWQERPLAVVVAHADGRPSDDELREHLRERVPRWWLPERFEFVAEIPRTGVGKVRKNELRARFGDGEGAA